MLFILMALFWMPQGFQVKVFIPATSPPVSNLYSYQSLSWNFSGHLEHLFCSPKIHLRIMACRSSWWAVPYNWFAPHVVILTITSCLPYEIFKLEFFFSNGKMILGTKQCALKKWKVRCDWCRLVNFLRRQELPRVCWLGETFIWKRHQRLYLQHP